ncbi:hypothetical protein ABH924_003259 [Arthrobacter sp. GAS37]|uniref:hypothetical protein n=1 Tax=Arthrobacter sp. GAS37 TaxID=3156261 RepID=UPI0038328DA1
MKSHPSPGSPLSEGSLNRNQLHSAVVQALHRLEPGTPVYIAVEVLTDELLPALSTQSRH